MNQLRRMFALDGEWCIVHVPSQPNGFGIMLFGDKNHFVDEHTSFWGQNVGRRQILKQLTDAGYTVFYSNSYGNHWGSRRAVVLSKRLYHIVLKQEILNDQVHVIAEGMGALVALPFIKEMNDKVRSLALINPCVDIYEHINQEKEHKFFYKKLIKELQYAYEITEDDIDILPYGQLEEFALMKNPLKLWQTSDRFTYDPNRQSRKLERIRTASELPTEMSYLLSEKRFSIAPSILQFFSHNEEI
ncbi:hypothetical protein EJF36_06065 [Bacillus sp. HMF5848]|uniref:hypothetical protein n=1 Tax=Bacillus sp. HMF5848 TaxID=2495421 RepID=UPI000F790327|nr:hypothetical protein [Bacillus sp. HMF5848]RSK26458.1 hypothetical protein EJF36_06065 [Bacillus sp. HMF5848]